MTVALLELHYHLRDQSHSMDALVRNKCEEEILAAFTQIAQQLGVEVRLESTAYREGGLKGGCTEFCVNGLMAGNRRTSRSGYDRKYKESSTQRSDRQFAG